MSPAVLQLHYHGRTGGVTVVMKQVASALLKKGFSPYVIVGEPLDTKAEVLDKRASTKALFPCPIGFCPNLAYRSTCSSAPNAIELADSLEQQAIELIGRLPDVWYLHNHGLGKNVAYPGAVYELARRGHRLLLQIHDFAEDGRPQNYIRMVKCSTDGDRTLLGALLYPQGSHVHYAVINKRDLSILTRTGIERNRLHYLPNCLASANTVPTTNAVRQRADKILKTSECPLFLYPTRAIERKNIGELLLWAAIERGNARFGITRAPQNPEQLTRYEHWKKTAKRLRLPITFEMGENNSLEELVRHSRGIITTSIAEGFGLCFLEPWIWKRPLVGRRLLKITEGLEETGLSLDHMYDKLLVPLEWIGEERFRRTVADCLYSYRAAYGKDCTEDHVNRAVAAAVVENSVDFGRLSVLQQTEVIERCSTEPQARNMISPQTILPGPIDLLANESIVREHFSLDTYSNSVANIVEELLLAPVDTLPNIQKAPENSNSLFAKAILEAFLDPELFWLLRSMK